MPRLAGDLLELRGLTKAYGGALALDAVSLSFRAGEIHALVGENGAGKSTLIRLCTGVQPPDAGEIWWEGAPLPLRDPRQARAAGIRAVYQEAEFVPDLSLAENLRHAEGAAAGSPYWLDWDRVRTRAEEDLRALAVALPVTAPAAQLSVGQRMMAEIAGCLAKRSRLLFLDEPTIGLDITAKAAIRDFITQNAAGAGQTVVLTSHDTRDIELVCDRVIVINQGRIVVDQPTEQLRRQFLAHKLVTLHAPGRTVTLDLPGVTRRASEPHLAVFEIDTRLVRVEHAVAAALEGGGIEDITIEDPPMEEVIREIYASV